MTGIKNILGKGKGFAVLIDPDKQKDKNFENLVGLFNEHSPDLLLVGGSLLYQPIDDTIKFLRKRSKLPVYIFPGDVTQISERADGILLLSLISGRNAEYLIGNHVVAAPILRRAGLEIVPTGYMLIENGRSTSVEYISNTRPIPYGKVELAVATAMAGEMLGLKMIYLEAGSGAANPVGIDMISAIREAISLPIVVGGGIRSVEDAEAVYRAGADMIVIGTQLEEFPHQIADFAELRDRINP